MLWRMSLGLLRSAILQCGFVASCVYFTLPNRTNFSNPKHSNINEFIANLQRTPLTHMWWCIYSSHFSTTKSRQFLLWSKGWCSISGCVNRNWEAIKQWAHPILLCWFVLWFCSVWTNIIVVYHLTKMSSWSAKLAHTKHEPWLLPRNVISQKEG